MFARTVTIQMKPGTMDEAARIYRESVAPAAKQQKGFKGALLLMAPGDVGKGMSISMWETMEDLEAGDNSGYLQAQIAKFGPMMAGPPTRDVFIVAVQV